MPEGVGFVGLGVMGAPMARNLLEAGQKLIALLDGWARPPETGAGRFPSWESGTRVDSGPTGSTVERSGDQMQNGENGFDLVVVGAGRDGDRVLRREAGAPGVDDR